MDKAQPDLRCPKCGSPMVARKGRPLAKCSTCGGLFIDRAAMKHRRSPVRQVVTSIVMSLVVSAIVARMRRHLDRRGATGRNQA
jgi:ribosomal protein L37AE/L43A